jgi:hypothetical protein
VRYKRTLCDILRLHLAPGVRPSPSFPAALHPPSDDDVLPAHRPGRTVPKRPSNATPYANPVTLAHDEPPLVLRTNIFQAAGGRAIPSPLKRVPTQPDGRACPTDTISQFFPVPPETGSSPRPSPPSLLFLPTYSVSLVASPSPVPAMPCRPLGSLSHAPDPRPACPACPLLLPTWRDFQISSPSNSSLGGRGAVCLAIRAGSGKAGRGKGWLTGCAGDVDVTTFISPCDFLNSRPCGDSFGVPGTWLGAYESA